jgi:hypothetical protein
MTKAPDDFDITFKVTVSDDLDPESQELWEEAYESEEDAIEDLTNTLTDFLNIEIQKNGFDDVNVEEMNCDLNFND